MYSPLLSSEKLLFIHIPKTAGTTFVSILRASYPPEEIKLLYPENALKTQYMEDFYALPTQQRDAHKVYIGHYHWGLHQYIPSASKYLTFLREPIAQVISHYRHTVNNQDRVRLAEIVRNHPNLCSFTQHERARNPQTLYLSGCTPEEIEKNPQYCLDKAIQNLENHFACIGITERFEESLACIAYVLGWEKVVAYESQNTGDKFPIQLPPPDEETLEAIKKATLLDRQLYDYGNQLLDLQSAKISLERP